MAKIIYKEGCEGQNKLSSIEGIEIDLFNGQKALIYPDYAQTAMLYVHQISKWDDGNKSEIGALTVTDSAPETKSLLDIGSPAAQWVSQFKSDRYGNFNLPSLLAAMEIRHQDKEIDSLAKTIEGADLLDNCILKILSCSRCADESCWIVNTGGDACFSGHLSCSYLVIPTILYR